MAVRMRGGDRRTQLLDEAAALVVGAGAGRLTMERLAERSSVSKALPYRHFTDADDVLVQLYRRETSALGQAVWDALVAARDAGVGDDLVRVSIRAYFDALAPRRALLAALTSPGQAIPALADPDSEALRFAARVLEQFHGVERDRSHRVAGMVQGALVGAAGTVLGGDGDRVEVEDVLVRMIHAALQP